MTSSILPFVVNHILEAKKQKDNDTSTIQTLNENIKTLLTLSSSVQVDQSKKERKKEKKEYITHFNDRMLGSLHHSAYPYNPA